jgi:ribosomal protein S18 acetylase RimI-like enzyme
VDDRIAKGNTSDYRFILLDYQGQLAGFVCFGAIGVAPRRYDLYWIAVHPRWQQLGFGRKLLSETEHRIGDEQGEILFIETSSRPLYQPTHKFYEKSGYTQVAMIPDFYADQDHRLVYMKRVTKAT